MARPRIVKQAVKIERIKEIFELHMEGTDKKDYRVKIEVDPFHIRIVDDFVFASSNTKQTIKRWENVVNLLDAAVQVLKEKQKHGN